MHTELSSFLVDVWENRDAVMYGSPDPTGKTVEDRVYSIYAPQHGITNAGITKDAYEQLVNAITAPANSRWRASRKDWAYVWDNFSAASPGANYRVYINAQLNHAVPIFQRIMQWAARPQSPSIPPNARPNIPPQSLASGYVALANRGIYADVIAGAKIAFAKEAFSGRQDIIVVYLNREGGRQIAVNLAQRIAGLGSLFRNDCPPMTERIAHGISIGPEVSGTQWSVDTSFGGVRTTLIAWAMIEAVTEVSAVQGTHAVPLSYPRRGSPNRLDFLNIVTQKFAQYNIDANAPWN